MPQTPRGVGSREEYPLPTGEGSGEGQAVPPLPLPRKLFVFFVENTYFDAF